MRTLTRGCLCVARSDPVEYLRSMQGKIAPFGIAIIQPPDSWARQVASTVNGLHLRRRAAPSPPRGMDAAPAASDSDGNAVHAEEGAPATEHVSEPPAVGAEDAAPLSAAPPSLEQAVVHTALMPMSQTEPALTARLQTVRSRLSVQNRTPTAARGTKAAADGRGDMLSPFGVVFTPCYPTRHSPRYFSISDLRALDSALLSEAFPDGCSLSPEEAALDREFFFWEVLASSGDASLLYCSDVEGTAFCPGNDSPWNLHLLPRTAGSLLRHCDYSMGGVNDPMLYVGMFGSMFCWCAGAGSRSPGTALQGGASSAARHPLLARHTEDSYLYSVSYLHAGAPKTWYGIPASQAHDFERVFCDEAFADLSGQDPELIYKKSCMVSPAFLAAHGVRPCRALQQAGQFVVTLPQAYHAGFSHGFTVAEAVNLATLDWVPYAQVAAERAALFGRQPVVDLEQVLLKALAVGVGADLDVGSIQLRLGDNAPGVALAVARRALEKLLRAELVRRAALRAGQTPPAQANRQACDARNRSGPKFAELPLGAEDRQLLLGRGLPCCECGRLCHLSCVQCTACVAEVRCAAPAGGPVRRRHDTRPLRFPRRAARSSAPSSPSNRPAASEPP